MSALANFFNGGSFASAKVITIMDDNAVAHCRGGILTSSANMVGAHDELPPLCQVGAYPADAGARNRRKNKNRPRHSRRRSSTASHSNIRVPRSERQGQKPPRLCRWEDSRSSAPQGPALRREDEERTGSPPRRPVRKTSFTTPELAPPNPLRSKPSEATECPAKISAPSA